MISTVCIQCSLKALIDGVPSPVFDETPEEHLRRVHPDPDVTQRERAEMEAQIRGVKTYEELRAKVKQP